MGKGSKVEFLVAICALVASAMAVYMAWDQGRVMRAQQHGAVYPVLQVDGFVSTTTDRASIGIRVSNSGVGPALIEEVRVAQNGVSLITFDELRRSLPDENSVSWAGLTGRALAPGEDIVPLQISWGSDDITAETLNATAGEWGDLDVRVCYCSVFDRCWETAMIGTSRAEPVDGCQAAQTDIFETLATLSPVPAPVAENGTD